MTWDDRSQSEFGRPRLSPGTRLNGIYEIDQPIGLGGMGEIYKGHLVETGDPVAIKMMLPELAENEAAFTLFRKEASALHHIQNDAVVRYYVFTVEPVLRRPYLAMEFVDGRTLSNLLHDDGALPFEAVRSLMQRLASGLQSAHQHGIIHRDVSPDNIIIPSGDVARAKIIDFGIARSNQHGTVIGSGFAGKFNYVSPEQLGLFGGNVTAKSDIYSLGLVLVQALTGQPLDMGGSHVEVIEKRRRVPDLGAIDMRFRPLLERMLQPQPDQRPDSMAAVAAWSLDARTSGWHKTNRTRPGSHASAPNPSGRAARPWRRAAAILLLLALTGGGSAFYYFGMETPIAPVQPPPGLDTPQPDSGATPGSSPASQIRTDAVEKIRNFVEHYDGGNCFFLTPVAIGEHAALIEGLGSSDKPFMVFDTEFKRANGFEPDIRVLQITQKQCPAIGFLAHLRGGDVRAPRLNIDQENLRNGDVLNGMVDRYGARNVDLIMVSDTGTVQNVALKSGTDAKTFNVSMRRNEGDAGRQPQLLIAVASSSPIDALRLRQPTDAEQFFANLLSNATRSSTSMTAVARYFMLEK